MAHARRGPRGTRLTRPALPRGDVATSTGVVRLEADPDSPGTITLYLDGVPSSGIDLADPLHLPFEYMQQMAVAIDWRFAPAAALRAIHLGGAACALPRAIDAQRPGSRQLVAEIDAELARNVRQWFDLPRAPQLRIRVADGRVALTAQRDGSMDLVVRDAFAPEHVPPHMATVQFFSEARRVLAPGGLLVANHAGRVRDPAAALALRGEIAALLATFESVALIVEPAFRRGRRHANVVSLATMEPSAFEPAAASLLARNLRSLPVPVALMTGEELTRFLAAARPASDEPEPGDEPEHGQEEGLASAP